MPVRRSPLRSPDGPCPPRGSRLPRGHAHGTVAEGRGAHSAAALAARLRACLADPGACRADLAALSAELLPAPTTPAQRLRAALGVRTAPRLLGPLLAELGPDALGALLPRLPAFEPAARGGSCAEPAGRAVDPADRSPRGVVPDLRQGRLGDCWLVAVLIACEAARPGFARSQLTPLGPTAAAGADGPPAGAHPAIGFWAVDLWAPARRRIVVSDRLPVAHRCGDGGLAPTAASIVEKAVAVALGGSYRRLESNLADVALWLLTGRAAPARPVPRRLDGLDRALRAGRPVVASTLVRPRGSFRLPREDGRTAVPIMDGHVYAVLGVARTDEDGRPDPRQPPRARLRNPLGGSGPAAGADLWLSARQLRRAFLSVNVGPVLAARP